MFNLTTAQIAIRRFYYELRRKLHKAGYRDASEYCGPNWLECPCSQCEMDRWETLVGDSLNPD